MWRNGGTVAMLFGLCGNLFAADLSIQLTNQAGIPLADAVVFESRATAASSVHVKKRQTIVQRGRVFHPFVTVVEKGTEISFPNDDPMLHHVYSFSPAKRFEIKLYKGLPAAPILFDKTGVVALGCNVHDWMLAYVLVVDTPVFAKSEEDGVAHLRSLVPGKHELMVWYPGIREPVPLQTVTIAGATESKSILHRLGVGIRKRPKAPPLDPMRYSLHMGQPMAADGDPAVAS